MNSLESLETKEKVLCFQELQGEMKNWKDSYGDTAFMKATRHGHYKICQWLLKEKLVDENAKNIGGWNALHLAARSCWFVDENIRPKIARLLLENTSIDINEQTNYGDTALYLAKVFNVEVKRTLDLEIYFGKNKGKFTN